MKRAAMAFGACSLFLISCTPREDFRGYNFDATRVAQIQIGQQTREQVTQILGTPSSVATFKEAGDSWYYIFKRTETVAFLAEELKDQKVVAIDFDERGIVKNIRRYGMEDARAIEVVTRETPTKGRELGLFEQLFGNLGRFNDQNTGRR